MPRDPGQSHAGLPIESIGPARIRRRLLIAGILLLVAGLGWADHRGFFLYPGSDRARFEGPRFRVTYMPTTDQLEIRERGRATTVKLVGLRGNAAPPPSAVAPGPSAMPNPQDWAPTPLQEALVSARGLTEGREVTLELPLKRTRDSRGRLLAYARLDEGRLLQEVLLESGMARLASEVDHPRYDAFREIERQARRVKAGLWQTPAPTTGTRFSTSRPATTRASDVEDEPAGEMYEPGD